MEKGVMAILVFLCAFGTMYATGSAEADATPVIEIASTVTEEGQVASYEGIFEQLVQEYNAANGTEYALRFLSGQGKDIINTRMSSQDKPDIFSLDSPADVHQYSQDGLLYDLTSYAEAYEWDKKLFDWAYKLSFAEGKVVTLPFGYEGMVLWYNKSLMEELGLNPGTITTLETYENALSKAAEAGYIPVLLGSQDWPWAQEWYLSILYSYTGRQLLKETLEGTGSDGWLSAPFRETVELYKSWHDRKYLAEGKSYILTSADAINAFTTGKALFKLEGTWAPYWIVPLEEAEQNNIGVMLHPAINGREEPHLPLAVGGMWCVSSDSEHGDIAAFILDGLMRQEYQGEFLQRGMDVAPIAVDRRQFEGLIPTVKAMWSMINTALDEGSFGYTTWAFYPPETRVYLYEGIVNVMEGNISVEEYLKEMQRLTKMELQQGFTPVIPATN